MRRRRSSRRALRRGRALGDVHEEVLERLPVARGSLSQLRADLVERAEGAHFAARDDEQPRAELFDERQERLAAISPLRVRNAC